MSFAYHAHGTADMHVVMNPAVTNSAWFVCHDKPLNRQCIAGSGSPHNDSLVPRPLPDFVSQPWRKIGRRPGTNTTSRTGNGGLDSYVMWTRFHNDGNVPTQYAASTPSDRTVKFV